MAQIAVFENGSQQHYIDVSCDIFNKELNGSLIHQVVVAYLAAGRSGTKAQKSRSDVSGGGAKPWRQKGGGRARAGSSRSPLWRTGGVTFAARPRDYSQKVNRKMYRGAMRSILSELLRSGRILVSNEVLVDSPKTKELIGIIKAIVSDKQKILIVTDEMSSNLNLAARNVPQLEVCSVVGMNPVSLVNADRVILTGAALKQIESELAA